MTRASSLSTTRVASQWPVTRTRSPSQPGSARMRSSTANAAHPCPNTASGSASNSEHRFGRLRAPPSAARWSGREAGQPLRLLWGKPVPGRMLFWCLACPGKAARSAVLIREGELGPIDVVLHRIFDPILSQPGAQRAWRPPRSTRRSKVPDGRTGNQACGLNESMKTYNMHQLLDSKQIDDLSVKPIPAAMQRVESQAEQARHPVAGAASEEGLGLLERLEAADQKRAADRQQGRIRRTSRRCCTALTASKAPSHFTPMNKQEEAVARRGYQLVVDGLRTA